MVFDTQCQSKPAGDKTRHFVTLDGLRGVAALAVVGGHANAHLGGFGVPVNHVAVDLFFILSGFVLANAYGARMAQPKAIAEFMRIRLTRLYPLYILGSLVGIAYYLAASKFGAKLGATKPEVLGAIAAAILMAPSPWKIDTIWWLMPFNMPGWSLFFEMTTNLMLVALWKRLGNALMWLLIVVFAILYVIASIQFGDGSVGLFWNTLWGGYCRAAFALLLGVAIFRLPRPWRLDGWLAIAPVAVLCVTFFHFTGSKVLHDMICAFVIFPALLYAGVVLHPTGRMAKIFAFLGRLSYPLYAIHYPVLQWLFLIAKHVPVLAHGAPWTGFGMIAICVVAAWFADRLYDVPVRRFLARRKPSSAAAAKLAIR